MLELLLALISLITWSSIGIYFFRGRIFRWLDNRFGKDTPPPPLDDEEAEQKDQVFSDSFMGKHAPSEQRKDT